MSIWETDCSLSRRSRWWPWAACDSRDGRTLTNPTPSPSQPTSPIPPGSRLINLGEEVRGTFVGTPLHYALTAPASGTFVVRLSWDPHVSGARLMISIGDRQFPAVEPEFSPVVARLSVVARQTYSIQVDEGHAPWDYHFNDRFLLLTSME
jgi:hypothetical protein